MGSMIESAAFEVVTEEATAQFFAPASFDLIDGLLGQYQAARKQIDQLAELIAGGLGGVVSYFIEGNAGDQRVHRSLYVDRLFQVERAVKALDADYWSRALSLTDVLDYMPQKRRDEWNTQLTAWKERTPKPEEELPAFEGDTVRSTIAGLLAMRAQFFGERVDGIFRALSHTHVTNCPQGFNKRMILSRVLSDFGSVNYSQAGCINDLRAVIAKFMGRDEPRWNATSAVIEKAKHRSGEWLTLDGGALRIRVYGGAGTAHLEVHPDMAWRLNQVLAGMFPAAIPAEFRTRPKKQPKGFTMIGRPLPFAVLSILEGAKIENDRRTVYMGYSAASDNKPARQEAQRVLERIGGVSAKPAFYVFDYDPRAVLEEIITTGCLPDVKSHQFYPTPENLAQLAVEAADIGLFDTCLEPSAGLGGLADLMPKDRTVCVEISALHCAVLQAKGHTVHQGDFLAWAPGQPLVDRIVMNPPYSEGRWQAHLAAAAALVNPTGGRLVAILPASSKGKDVLPGWNLAWSKVYENEFAGTSAAVVILTATR